MSLIGSGKLLPSELTERLLQYTPKELEGQPLGPLLLLVKAPLDHSAHFATELLSRRITQDVPAPSATHSWLQTSEVPTVRSPSQEAPDADLVELLAELGSATHYIVPLFAPSANSRAISIGRSPRSQVVFADPSVSADHAELVLDDGGVRILDRRSKNGTLVNGVRLDGGQGPWLQPMDRIAFGRVTTFVCEPRTLRAVLRQDLRTLL